jgi:hypothetical protein
VLGEVEKRAKFEDLELSNERVRQRVEEVGKEMVLKASVKDMCQLLD